eukprot:scaffold5.g626.t1
MSATAPKPRIVYFPIQARDGGGRAEPIRLALAAAGVEFEFEAVSRGDAGWKADLEHYHFAQVPRRGGGREGATVWARAGYIDDEVDMCQSQAILRHVGRKHGLYGSSRAEAATVDEASGVIEGMVDFGTQLFLKVVLKKEEERAEAAEAFWDMHADPASAGTEAPRGVHAAFLSRLLARSSGGFFLESGLSIADIDVAVMIEMLCLMCGTERVAQQWPDLMGHWRRVMEVPGIASYLRGPQRIARQSTLVPKSMPAPAPKGGEPEAEAPKAG